MSVEATPDGEPLAATWSSGTLWPLSQIALGIGAVVIGVVNQDPLGLLLTCLVALLLLPAGALQLLRRPRIEVVDGQLAIKKLGGVLFVAPAELVEVRALGVARWGARQHLLRLEYIDDRGREQLDVFTRGDLGADPRDVAETLIGLGLGAPGLGGPGPHR